MNVGHVAELHQAIGGECFVAGVFTEPFVAATLALEADQPLVARV